MSGTQSDDSVNPRRYLLALALVALALLAVVIALRGGGDPDRQVAADLAAKPNIVVIMTDDQALSTISAMPKTRRLIGRAGVSFDRFYATDPLCCPSRATFLTGQYAHNHGVISNGGPNALPALRERETLPVWMQRAGYATAFVGKYLNGYTDEDPQRIPPGWGEWHALVDPSTQNYVEYEINDNGKLNDYGPGREEYKTTVLGEKAAASIRTLSGADRPFFLYLGFNAPHAPATPAPEDAGAFAGLEPPDVPSFNEADVADKPSFLREREPVAGLAERVVARQQGVLESLLAVDREIARVVAALEREGELDRTYVVFTSDNGYFAGEHRIEYGKLLPYEESSRLPLLVRGPGVAAGEISEALVGNIDLAPTIAAIGGAEPGLEVDGDSLLPFADDPSLGGDRPLIIESLVEDKSAYYGVPYAAIRSERFLYVEYENGEEELYNLERDPFQLESRDDDPEFAATKDALAAALESRRECTGEACAEPLEQVPDPG